MVNLHGCDSNSANFSILSLLLVIWNNGYICNACWYTSLVPKLFPPVSERIILLTLKLSEKGLHQDQVEYKSL